MNNKLEKLSKVVLKSFKRDIDIDVRRRYKSPSTNSYTNLKKGFSIMGETCVYSSFLSDTEDSVYGEFLYLYLKYKVREMFGITKEESKKVIEMIEEPLRHMMFLANEEYYSKLMCV